MKLWTFFAGSTLALLAAVNLMARQNRAFLREEQVIDNTLDDSFPASDPPAFTADIGIKRVK